LGTFKGDVTFGAWLKRIVVNTAINHAKKKGLNIVSDLKNVSEKYALQSLRRQGDTQLSFYQNV